MSITNEVLENRPQNAITFLSKINSISRSFFLCNFVGQKLIMSTVHEPKKFAYYIVLCVPKECELFAKLIGGAKNDIISSWSNTKG